MRAWDENPTPIIMVKTPISQVINYYFKLKGWDYKEKEFYIKRKIIYARFTRPAKDLLKLCDQNVELAKTKLDKISKWANEKGLEWGIETAIKRWFDKEEKDEAIDAFEKKVQINKQRYGF